MALSISMDKLSVASLQEAVGGIKNGLVAVRTRAVNKTLTGAKTEAVAAVYMKLNLTKTRIRQDFYITKATYTKPVGKLEARGKPVGLISFSGTRPTLKGVSVLVRRDGVRTILRHAFIATAKTAENVWWREWSGPRQPKKPTVKYGRLPRDYRYDIHRLEGPRIEDILADDTTMYEVMDRSAIRYRDNLDYELDRLLEKYK